MKRVKKIFRRQYFRKAVIYFLTWCMAFNTSLPVTLAEVVLDSVINGDITVTPLGGGVTQDMTASDGAIGHFSDFDISEGHVVNCVQDSSNANALFRVFSGDGTQILGTFNANGNIYLIDSAGILFGANSQVNVNRLVASSLDISSNQDFLDGRYEFVAGEENVGAIVNNGTINAAEGAALIGRKILNTGTITTGEGGFVVMAAGDRVLLGEPGSHILVEMSSVTNPEEGDGNVINNGDISAPAGTVVLAAGDVFASALELPKVSEGIGRVEQNGHIHADGTTGDGGNVSLTAADEVVLSSGSLTTANAAIGGDVGLVVVHSEDRTAVETNAQIQATGGHTPEQGAGGFEDVVETTVEISGDYVNLAGSINASATGGKRGKVVVDALDMTVANGTKPASPADNTVYEKWIEAQSNVSTDVELVAHSRDAGNITVENIVDGEITGISGDIVLRTKYDTGGITFLGDPATIHTTGGGNIYMLAGEGGITTGDIITDVPSSDKVTESGKIRLLTTNYGSITTGALSVTGGSYDEISVIADSDLTINGDIYTTTNQVPSSTDQGVWQARTCLVSTHGDVVVNGEIQVEAHGKDNSTADIHIDAGQDVTINLNGGQIRATAKTSENGPANASVLIHAGKDIEGPGEILITDDGVNPTARSNAIFLDAKAGGGSDSAEIASNGDPSDSRVVTDGDARAELDIDEDRTDDCPDCPFPPGLVPPLDPWAFITHMGTTTSGDALTEDSLEVINHTEPSHGTLTIDYATGEYEYTPDAGFVGQDRFMYQAKVSDTGVETDWVEVTIDVTNELPVANSGSAEKHMGTPIAGLLNTNDVADDLGYIDDITVEIVEQPSFGTVTVQKDGDTWTYVYTPTKDEHGEYHVGTDNFTYSVKDPQDVVDPDYGTATITITLTNNPPVQHNDTVTIKEGQSVIINVLINDYDLDLPEYENVDVLTVVKDSITVNHGKLILNDNNTFTYIPDPGFVGKDTFTYAVKDGSSGQKLIWTTVEIWVTGSTGAIFIPAAPVPAPITIEVSGCPALIKWVAAELGTDKRNVQIWMMNALASAKDIQPCDACSSFKAAATILQDADGTHMAALTQVISQFASSTAPPTEEQMASISDAITNDVEGNRQYAAAGEYLDALAKYVGILTSEMGFSADEAVQFATDNYVQTLAEDANTGVAAFVAARLASLGSL
jgi:filamentous hemagglutinin family protein